MISAFYGSLYPPASSYSPQLSSSLVGAVQTSGFTTLILGLFHIAGDPNAKPSPSKLQRLAGDIVFNQGLATVSGGIVETSVVGSDPNSDWAHYLGELKASGSVDKIYLSFGGGGVSDFQNIISMFLHYLDPSSSSGPYIPCDSLLYKNFQALRNYLPMVDGVDIDQEEGFGQQHTDAMTAFGIMARAVGFNEVTYAPPFDSSLACYQAAAQSINAFALQSASLVIDGMTYLYAGLAYPTGSVPAPLPGISTRMALQFYSGGYVLSNLAGWEAAVAAIGTSGGGAGPVLLLGASGWHPISNTPALMESYFQLYPSPAWAGGFIWDFNAISTQLTEFRKAISHGILTGNPPGAQAAAGQPGIAGVNQR